MNKLIKIPTFDEMKFIEDYIKEQNFYIKRTDAEIIELFTVMVGLGLSPKKAVKNIGCVVKALKDEFNFKGSIEIGDIHNECI